MKIRQRTLYLRKHKDERRAPLFGKVCGDLQKALHAWIQEASESRALRDWPRVQWQGQGKQLAVRAWESREEPDHQLLMVDLTHEVDSQTWSISVQVGSMHQDEIVIQEVCRLEPAAARPPLDEIPDLLDFLHGYRCVDEDGLYAGRVYSINKNRAAPFADYVRSSTSERRLPVVLVSHEHRGAESRVPLTDLAVTLRGMAHVMKLNPWSYWDQRDLQLRNSCHGGALRVYLPGYSDDDSSDTHMYRHSRILAKADPDEVCEEIVRFVVEKSWSQDYENPVLASLEQERNEEASRRQVRNQVESARQRMRKELAAQTEAEIEALFADLAADYESLAQEYDRVTDENTRLQRHIKAQDDEMRELRYRLKRQWMSDDALPEPVGPVAQVALAKEARAVYEDLDAGERAAVDNQLLRKLLDQEMREHQTEAVPTSGGTYYVYPRSRTAGGRRIVYFLDDVQIKVCEIFVNHDAYETARNGGFDLSKYTDFTAWQPSSPVTASV